MRKGDGNRARHAFVIGAGRLGCALARSLPTVGVPVLGLWSRSKRTASRARRVTGLSCSSGQFPKAIESADLLFLTVSDDAVNELCRTLVENDLVSMSTTVIHCSGCLDLSPLLEAAEVGASIGSLHPLATFAIPTLRKTASFAGALALIDGCPSVARRLGSLARSLGMRPARLPASSDHPGQRALYHAAAVVAASGVLSTMDLALEAGEAAGLKRTEALEGLLFLARGTLEQLEFERSATKALTGPIARGDEQTIARHLEAFGNLSAEADLLYKALTKRAARVAAEGTQKDEE